MQSLGKNGVTILTYPDYHLHKKHKQAREAILPLCPGSNITPHFSAIPPDFHRGKSILPHRLSRIFWVCCVEVYVVFVAASAGVKRMSAGQVLFSTRVRQYCAQARGESNKCLMAQRHTLRKAAPGRVFPRDCAHSCCARRIRSFSPPRALPVRAPNTRCPCLPRAVTQAGRPYDAIFYTPPTPLFTTYGCGARPASPPMLGFACTHGWRTRVSGWLAGDLAWPLCRRLPFPSPPL